MDTLPFELIQFIFDYLNFKDQINFKSLSKDYFNKLRIYDLYDIPKKYKDKLNDEILKKFPYIKYLDAKSNQNIKNINNLTYLQKLNASYYMADKDIKDLNLIELNIDGNVNITNLNHMTNLKKLSAIGFCGIHNDSIKNLNLEELDLHCNPHITNLNHMKNLKKLKASEFLSGISDQGIKELNLIELRAKGNYNIININHMTNLKILDISLNWKISDQDIKDLNLEGLNVSCNKKITNVNHMTNLRNLNASGEKCGISDQGIKDLNLTELNIVGNKKIKNINHINCARLTLLRAFNILIEDFTNKSYKFLKFDIMDIDFGQNYLDQLNIKLNK